jgi:hypothetical protein
MLSFFGIFNSSVFILKFVRLINPAATIKNTVEHIIIPVYNLVNGEGSLNDAERKWKK